MMAVRVCHSCGQIPLLIGFRQHLFCTVRPRNEVYLGDLDIFVTSTRLDCFLARSRCANIHSRDALHLSSLVDGLNNITGTILFITV